MYNLKKNYIEWLIWLLLVVLWNYGYPEATPFYDVLVAVILFYTQQVGGGIFNAYVNQLVDMDANDTAQFNVNHESDSSYNIRDDSAVSIHLIG